MRTSLALLALLGTVHAAHALESLGTYDTFSGANLDGSLWSQPDLVREVVGGKLRVVNRTVASSSSNAGVTYQNWGVSASDPAAVTALGATITVTEASVSACAANPETGWVGARVAGSFFNIGTPTPGSLVGDVIAQARVMRSAGSADPEGTLRVVGLVVRCKSAECNGTDGAKTLTTIDLGTVSLNTPVKLLVRWDPPTHRFLFRRDSQSSKSFTYTSSDSSAPGNPFKVLQVRGAIENCTTGDHAGRAEATFDDAFTNASAAP